MLRKYNMTGLVCENVGPMFDICFSTWYGNKMIMVQILTV